MRRWTSLQTLAAFGGIATRHQLLANGHSGGDLTTAVQRGDGPQGPLRVSTEARRLRRTRSPPSRLGGAPRAPSAASVHGIWTGYDRRLHVSVARNASRLRHGAPGRSGLTGGTWVGRRLAWSSTGPTPSPAAGRAVLAVAGRRSASRQMVAWCDEVTAVACVDTGAAGLSRSAWRSSRRASRGTALGCGSVLRGADRGSDSGDRVDRATGPGCPGRGGRAAGVGDVGRAERHAPPRASRAGAPRAGRTGRLRLPLAAGRLRPGPRKDEEAASAGRSTRP